MSKRSLYTGRGKCFATSCFSAFYLLKRVGKTKKAAAHRAAATNQMTHAKLQSASSWTFGLVFL